MGPPLALDHTQEKLVPGSAVIFSPWGPAQKSVQQALGCLLWLTWVPEMNKSLDFTLENAPLPSRYSGAHSSVCADGSEPNISGP
jgi:hypothetical protein